MEESRTANTIKNVKTGIIMQILNKLMIFFVRTIFIRTLNTEYLGVNGLFSNILTMLSFAELGIGTAIIFNMYKPVAENDTEKIKSLMQFYKKTYNLIGIFIFCIGICIIPFMGILVKDVPNIKENIIFIYILFLINTTVSYFFTYKKSIISAYQKESIINKIDSICYLLKSFCEIIILLIFKNYILYLFIEILFTMLENILVAQKANKMFPYLKDKNIKKISKSDTSNIFSNVKSLVIYKFGSIALYGTDNILISSLINVSMVGLCSNYNMIINAVKSIVTAVLNGITASVGNLNAVAENNRKEDVFYQITFINFWIYSFCAIAFIVLLNPFINLWLGKEYILEKSVSIALAISFLVEGLRMPAYMYRVTLGLFEKGRITPYIAIVVNIVTSILLCKIIGVTGIFIGTIISQLFSYSWIDPFLIHKYAFKTSVKKYLKKYFNYVIEFSICYIVTVIINSFVKNEDIYGFIIRMIIVVMIPNIIILGMSIKSYEFNSIKKKIFKSIKNTSSL